MQNMIKTHQLALAYWGGAKGALPPPPKIDYRCSKLEVADQQGVVNSRSSTNKVYQAKKFLEICHNIDYLFDKHR